MMLEKSFLRCEEAWKTPPEYEEYDDEYICDECHEVIPKGGPFLEYNGYTWCESCVSDKLYDAMEIA